MTVTRSARGGGNGFGWGATGLGVGGVGEDRLYHGGAPGLRVGDTIAPDPERTSHLVDGCATCDARRAGNPLPQDDNDPGRVYVTTDRDYARIYAAGYPDGALYRVEVDRTDMVPSNDPAPSWGVASARVVGVVDRLVRLSAHDRRRLLRRYA